MNLLMKNGFQIKLDFTMSDGKSFDSTNFYDNKSSNSLSASDIPSQNKRSKKNK